MEPVFLTLEEILIIHRDQIARYGGKSGLRDRNLLLSAIEQPAATFAGRYLQKDIAEMAAAYLYHLVSNHPFIDGNKRVGVVTSFVFLLLNGFEFEADQVEFEKLVMGVADGTIAKKQVVSFLKNMQNENREV